MRHTTSGTGPCANGTRLLQVIVCAALGACGQTSPVTAPGAEHNVQSTMEALQFRVASRPSDMIARARLARLQMDAQRPGAAFRHLQVVREYGTLTASDRAILARLYAARFQARLAVGDGAAYEDALTARRLGNEIADEALFAGYLQAALVAFRRANTWGRRDAAAHLARAAKLRPDDPRLAVRDPKRAQLPDLARAALWLYRGRAMRVAMETIAVYVDRGGRDPAVLRAFVATRRWWGRAQERHRLDLDTRRTLWKYGVSACPASRAPTEVGCAGTLWSVATGPADIAASVRARARALGWRVASSELDAVDTRAWTLLAIRGFLDGDGAMATALSRRLNPADALQLGAPLGAASPALARAAGDHERARRELDVLLAQAGDVSALSPGDRVLVAFALAVDNHPRAIPLIDQLLASFRGAGSPQASARSPLAHDVWRIAVRHARSTDDRARVMALGAQAHAYPTHGAADREPPVRQPAIESELSNIALAYLQDPALSDRLATAFVDGAVYVGERAPAVAAVYAALGDAPRAIDWWQRVVEVAPYHTASLFELASMTAAAGDPVRARVHFTAALARSGDAGTYGLQAATWLLDVGHELAAIAVGKSALSNIAPDDRTSAYRLLWRAMKQLGRDREAADLHVWLERQRIPVPLTDRVATSAERTPDDATDADAALAWAASPIGRQDAEAAQSALLRALAWNPDDVRLMSALLERIAVDGVWHDRIMKRLWTDIAGAANSDPAPLSQWAARARRATRGLQSGLRGRLSPAIRRSLDSVGTSAGQRR